MSGHWPVGVAHGNCTKFRNNRFTRRLFRAAILCTRRVARPWRLAQYLRETVEPKLHLGCGPNVLPGWLNTDVDWRSPCAVYLDASRRLPLPDRVFDLVFAEHLVEHLSRDAGARMLSECHRVLKPGGMLRLSTPDLRFVLRVYSEPSPLTQEYLAWWFERYEPARPVCAAAFLNLFMRRWGHQYLYDIDTLTDALAMASVGFGEIRVCRPGQSTVPELRGVEQHGKVIPERFNEQESICVEAVKQ